MIKSGLGAAVVASAWIGCGGGGSKPAVDAPAGSVDAPVDAPIDAAPQVVTVHVHTATGAPVGGVTVYFQDTATAAATAVTTDTAGNAQHVLAAGGYVTAIDPFSAATKELYTIGGAQPGDVIDLAGPATTFQYAVKLPTSAASGVMSYQVKESSTGNANSATPATIGTAVTLRGTGTTTNVYVAANGSNNTLLQWLEVASTAISSGATVDLTAQTYAAAATHDYTVTHLPTRFDRVIMNEAVIDGSIVSPLVTGAFIGCTSGTCTGSASIPPVATLLTAALLNSSSTTPPTTERDYAWGARQQAFALDLATAALTPVSSPQTFDVTTHSAHWTEGTGGNAPQLVSTTLDVSRSSDSHQWTWYAVAPYTAGALTYPVLPATPYDFNPSATDTAQLSDFVDAKASVGYDAIRTHAPFAPLFGQLAPLVSGASGTFSLQRGN